MKRPITLGTRRELTAAIRARYQAANRNGKKLILDEFTKVAGYQQQTSPGYWSYIAHKVRTFEQTLGRRLEGT